MTAPVDQAARERAATEITTSIALTAGAGAGKTSVLVRRIASHLRAGADPSRIAAITFTEKAAAEILHRVRLELEDVGTAVDPAALALITISTLHSFARGLLVAEPLESGWAPDTDLHYQAPIADEVDAWWVQFRRHSPTFAERLDIWSSGTQRRAVALQLLDNRDLRARVGPLLSDQEQFDALVAARAQIESAAVSCTSATCTLLRGNDAFRAWLSGLVAQPPSEAINEAMLADMRPSKRGGRKGDWPGTSKDDFKDALDGLDRWRATVGEVLHGVLIRELLEHVVPRALAKRRLQAQATQQDLLFRSATMLRENGAVRARLAARFDTVLIDEVQDTDPLQAEVALLLARQATATGAWADSPPRPGALFAVGDPQQSIYRFRRADVGTWAQLSAAVGRGGATLHLSQNFRSVPGILSWVKEVFGEGLHPQVPWRSEAELDPVVVLHTDPADELEHAVAWVSQLMKAGRIADRDSGVLRRVVPGDLLFLVPRWKHAGALADRLERAGIAADVEGGRTFFQREEVKLALAVLTCLVEPGGTAATALVLRGLFGLTLEDLARHVGAGGSLRLTLPDPPPGSVGDALQQLAAIRRASRGSLVDLLDRTLDASGAAAAWVLRGDAASRFANIDKVRKLVRDEERAGGTRLEVLDRLLEQQWADEEEELSLTEPDQRVARVTTIFKAKGLEAPIVVALDLGKRIQAGDRIVLREEGEVLLSASKMLKPPGWSAAANQEKIEVQEEIRRLAYVAATRARDQFILLHTPRASIAKVFSHAVPAGGDEPERVEVGTATVLTMQGTAIEAAPDEGAVFPGWDERIDRGLREPARSDDSEHLREERLARRVRAARRASVRWESATHRAASRRGRGRPLEGSGLGPEAARLGEALHKVLEHLDLRAGREAQLASAERLTPAMVRLFAIADPRGEAKVLRATCGILSHPVMEEARQAGRHLKEVPFVTGAGRTRVTGTIDLAFPLDPAETRWKVVDWKIHLPAGGPARAQYEAQLALYAKAVLSAVTPCIEVETDLVGPHQDLTPPEPEDDSLELVLDAMRPLLSAILKAGAPPPEVGVGIGDDLEAELVWEAQRVAVLDGPVEAVEGWTVFGSDAAPETIVEALKNTSE